MVRSQLADRTVDWDDVRISAREDLFQTRKTPAATPSPFAEDGNAFTAAISS